MAGDWIKMRCNLETDPAVIQIASDLEMDEFSVVGRLHHLWSWADQQSRDGNAVGVTVSFIDRYVQRTGFAEAMQRAGWLDVSGDGVRFPNFGRHNGQTAKTRGLTSKRAAKHRKRSRNADTVTEALPEKRREEKRSNNPPTPLGGNRPVTVDDIEFPEGMDTPEVRESMSEWLQYKRDRGQGYKKPQYPQKLVNERMMSGPKAFVAAVNFSISNNYAGLFNAQTDSSGMADSAAEGGSRAERRQQSNAAALEAFLREGDGDAVRDEANGRIHGGGTEGVARRPSGLPPPDD